MTSWRERLAAARARGHFTHEDRHAWGQWRTSCPAAEVAGWYGWDWENCTGDQAFLWDIGDQIGLLMSNLDFDAIDRLLDRIEDEALRLKVEEMSQGLVNERPERVDDL